MKYLVLIVKSKNAKILSCTRRGKNIDHQLKIVSRYLCFNKWVGENKNITKVNRNKVVCNKEFQKNKNWKVFTFPDKSPIHDKKSLCVHTIWHIKVLSLNVILYT